MSSYTEALSYAANFCSMAEHCISEVAEKLRKFELSTSEQVTLIQRLQQEGYLDEFRYAKAFVKDKFQFGKWGRVKIKYALRQKGINGNVIDEALNELEKEEYLELLTSQLKLKKKSVKAKTAYELRGKLMRFAVGRGFEPGLVSDCLHQMGLEDDE